MTLLPFIPSTVNEHSATSFSELTMSVDIPSICTAVLYTEQHLFVSHFVDKLSLVQMCCTCFNFDRVYTVWPEILAGNLFWQIGGFESNPPIFQSAKLFTVCLIRDVINMSSTIVQNVRTKSSNFERMKRK